MSVKADSTLYRNRRTTYQGVWPDVYINSNNNNRYEVTKEPKVSDLQLSSLA